MLKNLVLPIIIFSSFINKSLAQNQDFCSNKERYYDAILQEVSKKNPNAINNLPECLKQDRNLILKAILIDPEQFQNASDILHEDKIFIKRAIKTNPEILRLVAPEIKMDEYFMEEAIYINRDSLKYCSWNLLDNKLFMKRMIDLDSDNYKYASDRLKSFSEFAKPALEDNGALLEFAPPNVKSNKEYVKIAVNSDESAIKFAHPKLLSDPEIEELGKIINPLEPVEEFKKFLNQNYVSTHNKKNLGKYIDNKGKFFGDRKIIDRNFIIKWSKKYDLEKIKFGDFEEGWSINPIDNRNYAVDWSTDFKKYPELIKKIEKFFGKRKIPPEIISDLRTTYLWKIKSKPLTISFNLYALSPSTDGALSNNFVNVTSISAIATELPNKKWQLSIIEVIFNRELKIDPIYENGHKKFTLWDLYLKDKNDQSPKIIYKVGDSVSDYFEVYQEQKNGKYRSIYKSEPIQGINKVNLDKN